MKIVIGADHRGFDLKKKIIETIEKFGDKNIEWIDVGCENQERCDYPLYAQKVAQNILNGEATYGILACGSGIGMALAANRFKGIYAGLCWNRDVAQIAHADDGINVLVLSADLVLPEENIAIVNSMIDSWFNCTFKEGRYRDRLDMVDSMGN
jgi:ribose 5-phosphate isomerase B